jgi:hypothetical protein
MRDYFAALFCWESSWNYVSCGDDPQSNNITDFQWDNITQYLIREGLDAV